MSIKDRIVEMRDRMRERSNISKGNMLVNSFIYGYDDQDKNGKDDFVGKLKTTVTITKTDSVNVEIKKQ